MIPLLTFLVVAIAYTALIGAIARRITYHPYPGGLPREHRRP